MKIYTRRGDKGETDLRSGERVPKNSPRIEAYGNVDEANAFLGFAVANLEEEEKHDDVVETLRQVQNHLFKAQADLANTDKDEDDPRVVQDDVDWLEERCDEYDEELSPLESFVLPSGAPTGSSLHLARTVTRRAERRVVALADEIDRERDEGEDGKRADDVDLVLKYLNRVSDLLFILGRVVNKREGVREESPTY
ncbi:MAG: cob(I)yrinic acid a,c-diamide adenosyltransferase [Halobacteria archaeon]|nr:cob(I)yrinic acid a,c-diamide adenosyltransferase [Halobacteria archaeon]